MGARRSPRLKLVVMINRAPWNELILRDECGAKSGRHNIRHRGLVLLQTSKSRVDRLAVDERLVPEDRGRDAEGRVIQQEYDRIAREEIGRIPRGAIVGAAMLVNCTDPCGDGDRYEYELSGARRFSHPIPFAKSGPVRWHTVQVDEQLERELRRVGMWRLALKAGR